MEQGQFGHVRSLTHPPACRTGENESPVANISETGTANGLNQLTQYAAKTLSHDTKGNVTGFGTDTFAYSSENLMTSATVGGTATMLAYDPLGRLYQTVSGAATSRFAYDGLNALAEYDSGGTLQRRWAFDDRGQAIVWYEGTGTGSTARRYLSADERGSVISISDSTGVSLGVNTYDEFGNPAATNLGRFGYTGQAWLPSAKLWYYKARVYHPTLGRFLQPDPIGYGSGLNLYAYVLNDPVNLIDPTGEFFFLVGAATGAGISIVTQVGANMLQGQSFSQAVQNISWGQVAVGAALGTLAPVSFLTSAVTGTARIVPFAGQAIALNTGERIAVASLAIPGAVTNAAVHKNQLSVVIDRFGAVMTQFFTAPEALPGYVDTVGQALNIYTDESGNIIYVNEQGEVVLVCDKDGKCTEVTKKK